MGFFSKLFKNSPAVKGYSVKDLQSDLLSTRGAVSPSTATQSATVYACVKTLAEDVAKLPLNLFLKEKKGRGKATDHDVNKLLSVAPNEYHTALEFREALTWDLVLRGQAFAFINRLDSGKIHEILPLSCDSVTVKKGSKAFEAEYILTGANGETRTVPRKNILHIRDLTLDGISGLSRIAYTAQTIGFSLEVEDFGRNLFANGARPGGVIRHPAMLSDDAKKRLRDSINKASSGGNAHGTLVLDEGMEWKQSSLSAEDSQFLATRQFQRDEILQIFRMPPHKLGDMSRATYSNIEQKAREYLTDTLLPWLVRWEQALYRDLLTEKEKSLDFYFRFNINGIVRADIQTRYASYQLAIQNGILSPDEVRELEDLSPRDDKHGNDYYYPANMMVAGEPIPEKGNN